MTASREALTLPLAFLTVVLLGGLRVADVALLRPPTPFALVLGILLVRVLVSSGTLAPGRLLSSLRSRLANLNGFIVLATLWMAAAQTFTVLTPESGLPRLAGHVLFIILLLNTAAAAPDRVRLLRSLSVMLGSAFVLKFVVLLELSTTGSSWFKGVLQAMLDGITLGSIIQDPLPPINAYLGFFTVALFLIGVFLLPHSSPDPSVSESTDLVAGRGNGVKRASFF
jgi:hypothetical protein